MPRQRFGLRELTWKVIPRALKRRVGERCKKEGRLIKDFTAPVCSGAGAPLRHYAHRLRRVLLIDEKWGIYLDISPSQELMFLYFLTTRQAE